MSGYLNSTANHCSKLNTWGRLIWDLTMNPKAMLTLPPRINSLKADTCECDPYVHRHSDMFTMWSCERQSTRGSCMGTICTMIPICVSVPFWTGVCVYVSVQCGGEGSLCGWSSGAVWGMLFWSGMRQNKQERSGGKSSLAKSKLYPPHNSMSSPAGPQHRPTHKYTLTSSLQHRHTRTHSSQPHPLKASWIPGT